jgi:ParB-like chromosome segregation protein Spo0J
MMTLTSVELATLQPHPSNYNRHPEAQLTELQKSLYTFKQFKNIVVCQGRIIAGHGLVEAAKREGLTHLDALVLDDLTPEQELAMLIADNALPFLAEPDTAALEALLANAPGKIPGVTSEWLHSIQIQTPTEGIDIDTFFGENVEPEREKHKDMITCPECGHEFEA